MKLVWMALLTAGALCGTVGSLSAQVPAYPAMAALSEYLMPQELESAMARSAAPKTISDQAEVMVLRPEGYVSVAQGTNGFLCIVERAWGKSTDDVEFWNPKVRAPHCFNPAAARSFARIYMMKTEMVLKGRKAAEIQQATATALNRDVLPPLAAGAMCYMMSKQQYLSDQDQGWRPHLMFFVAGDATKSWGANLEGSPVMAGADPEERVTVFMVGVGRWSDGTTWTPAH